MASVYIVKRKTGKSGWRWVVRCELGRADPIIHLGSFKTPDEARLRAKWARLELAAGRVPDRHRIVSGAETVDAAAEAWVESLLDVAPATLGAYKQRAGAIGEAWRGRQVSRVSPNDVQGWVAELAKVKAPGTVAQYLFVLRQVLDHAGVAPNPARDRRVRPPRGAGRVRFRLPTRAAIAAVLAELDEKHHPAFQLMERGGLRISEAHRAVRPKGQWRVLVETSKTAAGTRWVDHLEEYGPDAALLGGLGDGRLAESTQIAFKAALIVAVRRAGVPYFSAHDLRHLHASRLLHAGMSPAVLAARLGHANPSLLLRRYSHVLPPE